MAASIHEQILARVAAVLLAANTPAGDQVERGRVDAIDPDSWPAINVRRSTGTHNDLGRGAHQAYLEFELDFYVRGAGWETSADDVHMAAHAALMGDAELAAIAQDLRCIRTQPSANAGDETLGRLTATYQMQAATRIRDLTQAVR